MSTITRTPTAQVRTSLRMRTALVVAALAVACFHLAYEIPSLAFLMAGFAYGMVLLTRVSSTRLAFYLGLAIGLAIYVPQLWFFAGIFHGAAVALWLIASLWIAVFLMLSQWAMSRWPRAMALLAIPIFWTATEYFRSELYYLRFSWVNIGFAFSGSPSLLWPGVYGVGFFLMLAAALLQLLRPLQRTAVGLVLLLLLVLAVKRDQGNRVYASHMSNSPFVVGVQWEHASQETLLQSLDDAIRHYPDGNLFVLSEYSLIGPPPPAMCDWCADHHKYLIVGGTTTPDPLTANYHNTAFVVGPSGTVVFQQGKSVPIQFFTDGLPAESQAVWDSPWGKIGLCICYDLSYSRVTDRLIRLGARAIIVPTMDVESWGLHEHELHARVGPTRAAEYGVPVVRVCSSGISQIINADGRAMSSAPYPGQGDMIAGVVYTDHSGHLPIDRYLAPACVGLTGAVIFLIAIGAMRGHRQKNKDFADDAD